MRIRRANVSIDLHVGRLSLATVAVTVPTTAVVISAIPTEHSTVIRLELRVDDVMNLLSQYH